MSSEPTGQDGVIYTWGQLFNDGGLEVVADNQLLQWRGGRQEIASTLFLENRPYVAAPLDPSLAQAIRFPGGCEPFASLADLVAELEWALGTYTALDAGSRLTIAAFILSTWVAECVPTAPLLHVTGVLGAEAELMSVLACLCRRALVVADAPLQELCALPAGLYPTIIVRQPSKRTVRSLLDSAATPNPTLLRGGRLINFRHAAVLCSRAPLPAPAHSVQVLPSAEPYLRISAEEAQQLSDRLLPRLLFYRFSHHQKVSSSGFDCPQFSPELRMVGRVLGSTLSGSLELQQRLVQALAPFDEQYQVERSQQYAAVVIEACLALIKEKRESAQVEEIKNLVNAILLGRHEPANLGARKVGDILRHELGLYTKRRAPGYQLTFNSANCARIKRLTEVHSVLSLQLEEYSTDVHDVQDVLDVHDVHDVHLDQGANLDSEVHNVHDLHPMDNIQEQST
jgi:hypothetical protein